MEGNDSYEIMEGIGELGISLLPYKCDLWMKIMKGWDYFWQNISFNVRDGRIVKVLGA